MGRERFFGGGVLVGVDLDEERLHVPVGLGLAQRMVAERGALAPGLAQHRVVLGEVRAAGHAQVAVHVVVHERAQALPERQGDLEQGPDRGGDVLFLQGGQEFHGQAGAPGQLLPGQFLAFAIRADTITKLLVAHGTLVGRI
ncbi:hypothetical protein DSECCO2_609670 [anaerobic digester metagenome]